MAVAPLTGFKALRFDGESSTDYGVQILGEGVFNAPEREVEMINIPGRNGSFALDKGRFENIEVKYPANLIAGTAGDFAASMADFRNMLCSKRGYVRLEDDYHPYEYRMAVYKEGLEVDEKVLRAGEFDIVFDCKPQRYLTLGEEVTSIASGAKLFNPTLFEAHPLLEVEGHGTITFSNGYTITLNDDEMGIVSLFSGRSASAANPITFDGNKVAEGDPIYLPNFDVSANFKKKASSTVISSITGTCSGDHRNIRNGVIEGIGVLTVPFNAHTFYKGTSENIMEFLSATLTYADSTTETYSGYFNLAYDGDDTIAYSWSFTTVPETPKCTPAFNRDYLLSGDVTADSTVSILGSPTYIDCEIGEVYKIEDGEIVSLNRYVDLGSRLPALSPGRNVFTQITYSGTFTSVAIQPRWWQI
jgi:phage-related protein